MIDFISKHAVDAMAIFGVLQIIARATPTPKDDEILTHVGKVLNFLFSKTNTIK